MQFFSGLAVFFIIWWTVLFMVLPFGVRSQAEGVDRVLGTDPGAPQNSRMLRKMIITTIVAALLFGLFYYLVIVLGYGVKDLPNIVPDFPETPNR